MELVGMFVEVDIKLFIELYIFLRNLWFCIVKGVSRGILGDIKVM